KGTEPAGRGSPPDVLCAFESGAVRKKDAAHCACHLQAPLPQRNGGSMPATNNAEMESAAPRGPLQGQVCAANSPMMPAALALTSPRRADPTKWQRWRVRRTPATMPAHTLIASSATCYSVRDHR